MEWKSEQYLKFASERTQPALDLAARINVSEPKKIIDIGCGPGNSTRVLKNKFPQAEVLGVDFSPNMVERAAKDNPDLRFEIFDASKDFGKISEKYDVVFSNACIQWVPNHSELIKNMMNILADGGMLAVQLPLNFREPIHRIIAETAAEDKWKNKFANPRIFYTLTVEEYFDILGENTTDFEIWQTVYMHRMPSHQSIIEWYRGTGLKPYLDALDAADSAEFEKEIYDKIEQEYPVRKNSEIIFNFPRLFFTARK